MKCFKIVVCQPFVQPSMCWWTLTAITIPCSDIAASYGRHFKAVPAVNIVYQSDDIIRTKRLIMGMDHFVYAPSQWETTLQCDVDSHWLGAYTFWFLLGCEIVRPFIPIAILPYLGNNNALFPVKCGLRIWYTNSIKADCTRKVLPS